MARGQANADINRYDSKRIDRYDWFDKSSSAADRPSHLAPPAPAPALALASGAASPVRLALPVASLFVHSSLVFRYVLLQICYVP